MPQESKRGSMSRVVQGVLLAMLGLLLAGILSALLYVAIHGIQIHHSGDVAFTGMYDTLRLEMPNPVVLTMPGPTPLVVSGARGESIPLELPLLTCPSCGGSMVLTRWNLWSGEIEWSCPTCNE